MNFKITHLAIMTVIAVAPLCVKETTLNESDEEK